MKIADLALVALGTLLTLLAPANAAPLVAEPADIANNSPVEIAHTLERRGYDPPGDLGYCLGTDQSRMHRIIVQLTISRSLRQQEL